MCRAELRSFKTIYQGYEDEIAFYVVNLDPTQDKLSLERFAEIENYTWPLAMANHQLLTNLNIVQQSTKLAFDSDGIIRYRGEYAQGNLELWKKLFYDLATNQ